MRPMASGRALGMFESAWLCGAVGLLSPSWGLVGRYLRVRAAAVTIQGAARRWMASHGMRERSAAATSIQAAWRGFVARRDFREQQR